MTFYQIRLKLHPEKYIGKRDSTYALKTDKRIVDDGRGLGEDAGWFKQREYAKTWTSEKSFVRFVNQCNKNWDKFGGHFDSEGRFCVTEVLDLSGSFDEYEAVIIEGDVERIEPLNNFLK